MKELGLIFTSPEVRAILKGRKSQTRRIVKPQPEGELRPLSEWSAALAHACHDHTPDPEKLSEHAQQINGRIFPFADARGSLSSPSCPYGVPGDRLWVRETWYPSFLSTPTDSGCVYKADDDGLHMNPGWSPDGNGGGWKRSTYMPRWASRITLEITGVRVERVQEINERDARAEGFSAIAGCLIQGFAERDAGLPFRPHRAVDAFHGTWEETYGDDSWGANPWVWVIEFKRVKL
jgi:hypothetical protein